VTRIDRTIDSIIGGLENLTVKLPHARAILLVELAGIGEPAGTAYDGDGIRGGGENTPTEAGALTRVHVQARLDGLSQELNAMTLIVTNLLRECDRIIGTPTVTYRCDGGVGRDGYTLPRGGGGWSEPDCFNVPSEGRKTCDQCRQRAYRWKRDRETAA
jgi:hypothetical protein